MQTQPPLSPRYAHAPITAVNNETTLHSQAVKLDQLDLCDYPRMLSSWRGGRLLLFPMVGSYCVSSDVGSGGECRGRDGLPPSADSPRILHSEVAGVLHCHLRHACLQGGPIYWVAVHRMHHRYTDKEGDPHSPRDGKWWSHMDG